MASQTMTRCRNRSDGTEAQQEARRNRLEVDLAEAKRKLALAVGPKQTEATASKIAAIEEEM